MFGHGNSRTDPLVRISVGVALIASGVTLRSVLHLLGEVPVFLASAGAWVILRTLRQLLSKPRPGTEHWHRNAAHRDGIEMSRTGAFTMTARVLAAAAAYSLLATIAGAQPQSQPYSGQENRSIKSLSAEEVDAYLAGKGMGLAKAAELNGYAGPAHVLELAPELNLTAAQRASTEAVFASMQSEARSIGRALVEAERKLDQLFATQAVTDASLTRTLQEIGSLQAKLRATHLRAHLEEARILTPEQSARYAEVRGYASADPRSGHHAH